MVLDLLSNAARYTFLREGLSEAFGFLGQPGLEALPDGEYEVLGSRVRAIVSRAPGRSVQEGRLEAHRKYIDIQYLVSGQEKIGWSPREGLVNATPYDEEADIEFFGGAPESLIGIPVGCFAVFMPSDAHLPLVGEGMIHKVVVKVLLD